MLHDEAIHAEAIASGDFAEQTLFDDPAVTVALIHFADGSHGVRLDLVERGLSLVIDTPAWLDLDTVLPAVSPDEPTLSIGYAILERHQDGEVGYRVTFQGGDVVGRVSIILLEAEIELLRAAAAASAPAVEAADELDHQPSSRNDALSS